MKIVASDETNFARFGDVLYNRDLLSKILSFLDVVSLIGAKPVCSVWIDCCELAINRRCKKRVFSSNEDLREAVITYMIASDRYDIEYIAREFGYPIGKWDVSKVKDFSRVFYNVTTFNENIGSWNVSNAKNMSGMFWGAKSFNCDLSEWDVSNVTNTSDMFRSASYFNGDLSNWDVSRVTNMSRMFAIAKNFNGDLSKWSVSSGTAMSQMFDSASNFNGDLSNWNVSMANKECMFQSVTALQEELSLWDLLHAMTLKNPDNFLICLSIFPLFLLSSCMQFLEKATHQIVKHVSVTSRKLANVVGSSNT